MKVAGAFGLFHRIRVASVHVNRISRFMGLFVPRIHESRSIVKASSISWREKADKRYNVLYILHCLHMTSVPRRSHEVVDAAVQHVMHRVSEKLEVKRIPLCNKLTFWCLLDTGSLVPLTWQVVTPRKGVTNFFPNMKFVDVTERAPPPFLSWKPNFRQIQ